MVALNRVVMSDLGRQKYLEVDLDGSELTPEHTVGQTIEHYLGHMRIPDNGLPWRASSRGVMLDSKRRLKELEPADHEWTVIPEVSAG